MAVKFDTPAVSMDKSNEENIMAIRNCIENIVDNLNVYMNNIYEEIDSLKGSKEEK